MDSSQTNMALAAPAWPPPGPAEQRSLRPNHLTQEAPDTEPHRQGGWVPGAEPTSSFSEEVAGEASEGRGPPEITQQDSAFVHLFGDLMLLRHTDSFLLINFD